MSTHDADDIVQQAMMMIASQIERFNYDKNRGHFRQWVRSITENKIIDHFRKVRPTTGGISVQSADEAMNSDAIWDEQWKLQDLLLCLDEVAADFAPRRVEAFRLYVMDGLSAAEVAKRLEMSIGHVYVTRTQIINRVRQRMQRL